MSLMTTAGISELAHRRFNLAAVGVALLALTAAGCGGGGEGGAGGGGAPSSLASGSAFGARGPIVGATVTAYKAGTTGYGQGATVLATAITNSSGGFTFTSGSCNIGDLLYYVSRGGNAGAGVNPAIVLMSAVGICGSLPGFVFINEVTTVASAYALAQFMERSSPYSVGASATNYTGLKNAFGTAGNLANVSTGFARSITPTGGTAPQRNVNTLANALVSCVNTAAGSPLCAELFACAKPGAIYSTACSGGTGTTPTDTLGAILNVALNPARVSAAGIYHAATIQPVFAPTLASAPGSQVLVLNFAPSGANFRDPFAVAVDAAGNVWVPNASGSTVTELNSSGGLVGNFNNTNTPGANFNFPDDVAIDAAGNVWLPNNRGNTVTELDSSGGLVGNFNPPGSNFNALVGKSIDAAGNFWVTNVMGNTVTELNYKGGLVGNFNPSGANFAGPLSVAIDATGNAWVPNFRGNTVTELNNKGDLVGNYHPSGANFAYPRAVAIDAASNAWVANESQSGVTELNSTGGLVGNFNNTNTPGANFADPLAIAIDAAGNVWVTNYGSHSPFFVPPTVSVLIGAARPVLTPLVACLKQSPAHAVCLP